MSITNKDFELNKIGDVDYLLQEEVCRRLFEFRYQQKIKLYEYDGQDPEHFLHENYKEERYRLFRQHIEMLSRGGKKILANYISLILYNGAKQKIFYNKLCVVCLDNKSAIVSESCSHHVMCKKCVIQIFECGGRKCPLCRTYIRSFLHYDF